MIKINKPAQTNEFFKKELKVQIRKAIKQKKLRKKMSGLKALRMGKGFSFAEVGKFSNSPHSIGGGLSNFLMKQINGNIPHIGINGFVEANIVMTKKSQIDKKRSRLIGDSKILRDHVWNFLLKRVKLNRPFWKKLGRKQMFKVKFFFLNSINSRDIASQFARKSYETDNALVIFTYKRIKPYNYSNAINLLDI